MKLRTGLAAGSALAIVCVVGGVVAAPSPAPAASASTASASVSGPLRAGAAKVDITPAQSLLLDGDTIRDHLFTRAIMVSNGATCAVLVGMDLGNARNDVIDAAIPRIATASGCPAQNILISATHTHSAGTTAGGLGGGTPSPQIADAIVEAVRQARTKLEPVRMGYGTAQVDLNVNRDLFDAQGNWRQAANPAGPSDKTLAVVEFIGNDNVPVGVYMNYAMHPVNFYNAGVISADFPGEASNHIESTYNNKTVAIFTQGASGDQNPKIMETTYATRLRAGRGVLPQTIGAPATPAAPAPPPPPGAPPGGSPAGILATTSSAPAGGGRGGAPAPAAAAAVQVQANGLPPSPTAPVPAADLPAYRAQIQRLGDWVRAMGLVVAEQTINVMRTGIPNPQTSARIWSGTETFTCPGRTRLDAANPARENVYPGYSDGPDIPFKVGLIRLGDISFVSVNGEVYSEISSRLKRESPLADTMMVTLGNGAAASGYIYSNNAANHLSFQVIGSRLKPYCAEDKIVAAGLKLINESQP